MSLELNDKTLFDEQAKSDNAAISNDETELDSPKPRPCAVPSGEPVAPPRSSLVRTALRSAVLGVLLGLFAALIIYLIRRF